MQTDGSSWGSTGIKSVMQDDLPGTTRKVAEIGFTQVEPYDFVATAKELGRCAEGERSDRTVRARTASQPGPG